MKSLLRSTLPAFVAAALITACGGSDSTDTGTPAAGTVVTAAQMTDDPLNTILFTARPGDTILLPAGKYTLNGVRDWIDRLALPACPKQAAGARRARNPSRSPPHRTAAARHGRGAPG